MTVKCNQTGKLFKVRVSSLLRSDDGHMSMTDLAEKSQLLMMMNRKKYLVIVQNGSVTLKEAVKEVQVDGDFNRCVLRLVTIYFCTYFTHL